ncbi:hypothetical protein ACKUSY_02785 [Myroides odoratus]
MLVRNENFMEQDLKTMLGEIMNDLNANPNVEITEMEAKRALSEMIYEGSLLGNQAMLKNTQYAMPIAKNEYLRISVLSFLWEEFKKKICPQFDEETEQDKIAEIVASVIAELVPYRILVKPLLKKVLFFILKKGHRMVCLNVNVYS